MSDPRSEVKFCIRCGSRLTWQERYGLPRPVCPACGWVYFEDPKVAAGVLVPDETGKVLLVQRSNPPFEELWTLPAGFVNAREDPPSAAARECEEETGLQVEIVRLLDVCYGREHPRGADFILFYLARLSQPPEEAQGALAAGDDAAASAWFPLQALPALAFRSTRSILQAWARET